MLSYGAGINYGIKEVNKFGEADIKPYYIIHGETGAMLFVAKCDEQKRSNHKIKQLVYMPWRGIGYLLTEDIKEIYNLIFEKYIY